MYCILYISIIDTIGTSENVLYIMSVIVQRVSFGETTIVLYKKVLPLYIMRNPLLRGHFIERFHCIALLICIQTMVIHHESADSFAIEIYVEFNSTCSSKTNFNKEVTVPRGSSILNVLEHAANQEYLSFNGFEVFYLANSGYHLWSLHGEKDTSTCNWVFTTDPATIPAMIINKDLQTVGGVHSKGLNDVYVTNNGMVVTFKFDNVPSLSQKHKDTKNNKFQIPPWVRYNQYLNIYRSVHTHLYTVYIIINI